MNIYQEYLGDVAIATDRHGAPEKPEIEIRVERIRSAIRATFQRSVGQPNHAFQMEEMRSFLRFLRENFPSDRFRAEEQEIPKHLVRTTDRNFIVTVPGKTPESIVLVAHYDTWAGFSSQAPGADDNSTGEEILKQYLLQDLLADDPPPLTHVFVFAGSEECGTRGLISQVGLTAALSLISLGISTVSPVYFLASIPFLPLMIYRFGVTGTRHFVTTLSEEEKGSIRAAIAVDSVGEGTVYIPENEMGANFIRALFPYEGSEHLNDLLEEAAHLHHIPFHRFIAGGTTDSVAFLEERPILRAGLHEKHIPAAALITMSPGKCSPFIAGGKLHTSHDTPERVYAEPLAQVLTILDYAFHILHGGQRPSRPRHITEHHYARLYRDGDDYLVALKDAIEPNNQNLNSIFLARGTIHGSHARLTVEKILGWGVETTLDKEVRDLQPTAREVSVRVLELEDEHTAIRFERPMGRLRVLEAAWNRLLGGFERLMGRYSFLAMFGSAILVGFIPTSILEWAVVRFPPVGRFVATYYLWTVLGVIFFELAVLFRLFTRDLPAWLDNASWHENRADNLRSLRRTASSPPTRSS